MRFTGRGGLTGVIRGHGSSDSESSPYDIELTKAQLTEDLLNGEFDSLEEAKKRSPGLAQSCLDSVLLDNFNYYVNYRPYPTPYAKMLVEAALELYMPSAESKPGDKVTLNQAERNCLYQAAQDFRAKFPQEGGMVAKMAQRQQTPMVGTALSQLQL